MGRSRAGLTTKIHALVDAEGRPIVLKLTEGQAHDGRSAEDMLGRIGEGQILLADRAYDSDALRLSLAERGAWANVKPMPRRVRIPAFSPFLYRFRNLVERFFNKLKHFRAVASLEQATEGVPERVTGAGGSFAQERLQLGEGLLDRVQVGGVGRQVERARSTCRPDRLGDAGHLVSGQVVHDHDIARGQLRHEHLLDVGAEGGAVMGLSSTKGAR